MLQISMSSPIGRHNPPHLMRRDNLIEKLHFLAERCNDGAEGYSLAGNLIDNAQLRLWLFDKGDQRRAFAVVLNELAIEHGGEADLDSTFLGKLHREWLDFKSDIVDPSIAEVLEECIRGEEKAAADYRHILNEHTLPLAIERIVRQQATAIAHSRRALMAKEARLVTPELAPREAPLA